MFKTIGRFFRRLFGKRMSVFTSSQDSQAMPEPTAGCAVVERTGERVAYACGHEDSERFAFDFYGEVMHVNDPFWQAKPYCGDCFLKLSTDHTIRCALCGFIIRRGEAVALYAGGGKFRKDIATKYDGQWIGCMRWNCCPSGGFFAGHWTSEGFKPLFKHGSMAAEVMATGKPMIATTDGGVKVIDDEEKKD